MPIYPQLSFKNVESYHDDGRAHRARLGRQDAAHHDGDRAGSSTRSSRASRRSRRSRPSRTSPPPAPGALDVNVDARRRRVPPVHRGSTSRPKGVVVTHANLAEQRAFMIDGLAKDPKVDKGVSWLPLYHDMGLIGFVIGAAVHRHSGRVPPHCEFVRAPRIWLDAIHRHRGTITYAPNFAYALVAKRLKDKDVAGLDLSCVRIAGCGAEPIQAEDAARLRREPRAAGFDPKAYPALVRHGRGDARDHLRPARDRHAGRPRRSRGDPGAQGDAVPPTARGRWSSSRAAAVPRARRRHRRRRAGAPLGERQIGRSSRAARASRRLLRRARADAAAWKNVRGTALAPHGRPRLRGGRRASTSAVASRTSSSSAARTTTRRTSSGW